MKKHARFTKLTLIMMLLILLVSCRTDDKPYQTKGIVEAKLFYVKSPQGGELKRLYVKAGESIKQDKWIAKVKGESTLKAPADCRVMQTFYFEKEYVSPGSAIASLLLTDEMTIIFYVPENDMNRIQYKKVVTIRYRNHDYPAKIVYIADQAEYTPDSLYQDKNRHKSVFKVKTDIPNQLEKLIKLGQSVEVIYE